MDSKFGGNHNYNPEAEMRKRRSEFDHRLEHPAKTTSWKSVVALLVFIAALAAFIILI